MVFSLLFFGAAQSGIACCYLGIVIISYLIYDILSPIHLDISPRYSSIMNTLGNTIGALAGVAVPLVVSALLRSFQDAEAWQILFFLTFAQCVVALIVFYFYQSDTIVDVLNNPYRRG